MKNVLIVSVLGAVLAVAPACEGQPTPPGEPSPDRIAASEEGQRALFGPRALGLDPVSGILARSSELELTDEQITRLEALRDDLRERNAPLMEALREELGEDARMVWNRRGSAARGAEDHAHRRMDRSRPSGEERQTMRERMRERAERAPEEREALRERMRERGERMAERRAGMRERHQEVRQRMEAVRPQLEALRETATRANEEIRSILTEEQQERFRELRMENRREMRSRRR